MAKLANWEWLEDHALKLIFENLAPGGERSGKFSTVMKSQPTRDTRLLGKNQLDGMQMSIQREALA